MAATPATLFGTQMTSLTGNVNGAIQSLPHVDFVGGKDRTFAESIAYAAQASASVFGVARIPLPFVFLGLLLVTDTSTSTATLAFGNAGNGNSAIYAAAAALTATDTPTWAGKTAKIGTEITSGFDCVTGLATGYGSSSGFGGAYEDVIMTTGTAALPASGNLRIQFQYAID